ncbi:hypothetical protein D6810_02510 [Candidatus Dojkabacteria bacterium]|uniref:Uncharacterized protein n=1 Tax=Candidatus Dojkabacteria bacterium TaxID=2099670 RepID=A0A3M0Z1N0_9BACT|nr:MAG: hypothetical protein D6810_02510 [Candidatus Dojkabacteria bacterium]
MKKDKSGRIIASLTEVKNRTGDVFALVDQFGTVFLTSYKKIRYKIEKVNFEFDDIKPETVNNAKQYNYQTSSKKTLTTSIKLGKLGEGIKPLVDTDYELELDYVIKSTGPLNDNNLD